MKSSITARVVTAMVLIVQMLQLEAQVDWNPVNVALQNSSEISSGTLAVFDSRGLLYSTTKGTGAQASFTTGLPVASASKWVSASIIGKLVNNGLMSFDDHPQKYITWWTSDPADKRAQMTLRQLLAFTSGFGNDNDCTGWSNVTYDTCAQMIYNASIPFQPGKSFYYSANHLKIAGLMAMIAAGTTSWQVLWNTQIKTPLSLGSSAVWTLPGNENPAGTLFITPNDHAKWLTAYFGGQLFSDAIRVQLETDNTPAGNVTIVYSPWMAAVGQPRESHYCQGNWYECDQLPFNAACAAAQLHSSAGSFGTVPWIDRVNNYYGLLTTLNPSGSGDLSMNALYRIRPAILVALGASRTSSSSAPLSSSAPFSSSRAGSSSRAASSSATGNSAQAASSSRAASSSATAQAASSSATGSSNGGLGSNQDSSSTFGGNGSTGESGANMNLPSLCLFIQLAMLFVFQL